MCEIRIEWQHEGSVSWMSQQQWLLEQGFLHTLTHTLHNTRAHTYTHERQYRRIHHYWRVDRSFAARLLWTLHFAGYPVEDRI